MRSRRRANSSVCSSATYTSASHTEPNRSGWLGGVGDPGGEREAADHTEHPDDGADQRRPGRERALASSGIEREADAGRHRDRRTRRAARATRSPTGRRLRRRRRRARPPATPTTRPRRPARGRPTAAPPATTGRSRCQPTSGSTRRPSPIGKRGERHDGDARRHRRGDGPTRRGAARGASARSWRAEAQRGQRGNVVARRAHRPGERLPDDHQARDARPRARTAAARPLEVGAVGDPLACGGEVVDRHAAARVAPGDLGLEPGHVALGVVELDHEVAEHGEPGPVALAERGPTKTSPSLGMAARLNGELAMPTISSVTSGPSGSSSRPANSCSWVKRWSSSVSPTPNPASWPSALGGEITTSCGASGRARGPR